MPSPTCAGYEGQEVGEELLRGALRLRGCEAGAVIWDEPGIDWSAFDLCLIRSTWDYHEKHQEFVDWARRVEAVAPLQNPAKVIAWNSDKTWSSSCAGERRWCSLSYLRSKNKESSRSSTSMAP